MAITLSRNALLASEQLTKKPSLVVQFDGIDTIFGSSRIVRVIRIGDPELVIGNSWTIGGSAAVENQISALSFNADFGATTTKIDYQLNPDRGIGSSISSLDLAFVDDDADTILTIFTENEMLGRKVRVWLSPNGDTTDFSQDYIVIFRGIVDNFEASAGGCLLTISHPDQKKRQALFNTAETELSVGGGINSSTTSITLLDTSNLLVPVLGPTGVNDTSLKFYIQIDDEIIRYTGVAGPNLSGVVRGQLGTTAAAHDDEASVRSFYTLEGNAIDLALKLMLSGWNDYYATGVAFTAVNRVSDTETVANSIVFNNVDVEDAYGITVGDFVTVSGCTNGANNVTMKAITDIVEDGENVYFTVSGVSFVTEAAPPSGAVVAFRSRYDTLGEGLKMSPDEVDVYEHERLQDLFLSSFDYLFYLKDTISNCKEFIEQKIYSPIACYSIPRRARSSVGYHIGPIPNIDIPVLDESNIRDPGKIVKRRSTGKNFYNTVIYKYDEDVLSEKFLKGDIYTDTDSREQIKLGTKALIIEANGLRNSAVASSSANRRLNRYAFGAEYFTGVKVFFKKGFNVEIGDLVILDGTNLHIADLTTGLRGAEAKLYEIVSKSFDIAKGDISLGLVDTNFSTSSRYALISPASFVRTGTSGTSFQIEESFSSTYGADEYLKWERFDDLIVRVRTSDYGIAATAAVDNFSGNTVTLTDSLGFTPSAGMLMEMADYGQATPQIKLVYGFISEDASGFSNDDEPYRML